MGPIKSEIIGNLNQNIRFEDWWESELIDIPFFNDTKLKITFVGYIPKKDPDFIKESDEALNYFLQKTKLDRLSISNLIHEKCSNILSTCGIDETTQSFLNIKDKNQIWDYIIPKEIYVARRPYQDRNIYININCEFELEQEHGLQLVFRRGKKITRVSQIDGHLTEADAYDKPDIEDILLSEF